MCPAHYFVHRYNICREANVYLYGKEHSFWKWVKGWALFPSLCVFCLCFNICFRLAPQTVYEQLKDFTKAYESLKDGLRLVQLWVKSLVMLHTLVFIHITSAVKPGYMLLARSRVSKSCLKSELFVCILSVFLYVYIQVILMPDRRHKKLNLLIEFWNSNFTKLYFKA